MRLGHYSIHTERSYCDWIKRYVFFHHMISRDDLKDGETKIEAFLPKRSSGGLQRVDVVMDGHLSFYDFFNFLVKFSHFPVHLRIGFPPGQRIGRAFQGFFPRGF